MAGELKLKGCPFCGSAAEMRGTTTTEIACTNDQCISTGAFNDFGHREQAIEAWNRRASRTDLELVRSLEEMCAMYVALVESGDCGSWDPECVPEMRKARKALAASDIQAARGGK